VNFEYIINNINNYLKNSITKDNNYNSGLYAGVGGVLLYERWYNYYTGGKVFLTNDEFDKLISCQLKYENNSVYFSNGGVGLFWALHNMWKYDLIELNYNELSDKTKYLTSELLKSAENNEWDNLHGSFGIFYFLTESNLLNSVSLNSFLGILKDKMYEDSNFVFYTKEGVNGSFHNLSLAHGISGHILILLKAANVFPENDHLKNIIKDMAMFLMRFCRDKPLNGYFPQCVFPEKEIQDYENVRLGWCYGDIGPGMALFRYSQLVGDSIIENKAMDILLFASSRREVKSCRISDASLCHGTSGIMHIFNRLFMETNNKRFELASNFWLEKTLFLYDSKGLHGFSPVHYGSEPVLSNFLIEGNIGVGLSLLAKMYTQEMPNWDGCIFIA
jgi:hypothetical protein